MHEINTKINISEYFAYHKSFISVLLSLLEIHGEGEL